MENNGLHAKRWSSWMQKFPHKFDEKNEFTPNYIIIIANTRAFSHFSCTSIWMGERLCILYILRRVNNKSTFSSILMLDLRNTHTHTL